MLALTLALSPEAAAQTALTLGKFSGPKAAVSQKQLAKALCAEVECIKPPAKGKLPRKKKPSSILKGTVLKSGKKLSLQLVLTDPEGDELMRDRYPLAKTFKLAPAVLKRVTAEVVESLELLEEAGDEPAVASAPPAAATAEATPSAGAVPPVEATPPPAATPPAAAVAAPAPSEPLPVPSVEASAPAAPPPPPTAAASAVAEPSPRAGRRGAYDDDFEDSEPSPRRGARRPLMSLGLSFEVLNRDYKLDGQETDNLYPAHQAPFWPMPAVSLELNPLASSPGILSGLGLAADFAMGFGVSTPKSGDASVRYPNSYYRGNLAVRWELELGQTGLAMTPAVGVSTMSYSIADAPDGTSFSGLPGVGFTGLKTGLLLSWSNPSLRIWASGSALPMFFATGPVVSADYFSAGKVFGIDAGGGLAYKLSPSLEAGFKASLVRYSLTFTTQPSDTYRAKGATDQYLYGGLSLSYLL